MSVSCTKYKGLALGAGVLLTTFLGCSGSGIAVNTGGSSSNGGSLTGGAMSGGASATGGSTVQGGSSSNAGGANTGGVAETGGAPATGGASPTGGQPSSGGIVSTGGTKAAGGATATGGKTATGGLPATGGTKATGGSKSTGSTTSPGGASGTGGSSNAGGSSGSPGCGSSNTTSPCSKSGTTCSLDISGTARVYYVQLPSGYNSSQPYPLIFQFHPWGGSAEQALTEYQLSTQSRIPNAIYVTPQGLQAGSNGAGWANTDGVDIAFTKAMVADVEGKYCVDTSRIFSVGFSYGGMMSFAVGCEMSDTFRAIAPMSGALYSDTGCKGTGPHVAMWGSHGTSDTVVPIANGEAARDKILQQNHCGTATTAVSPSPCVTYSGCDSGYPSTWCEFDGGHQPPSFASDAIAAFFKQF